MWRNTKTPDFYSENLLPNEVIIMTDEILFKITNTLVQKSDIKSFP